MADSMTDSRLENLIGQHPAALRSVSWGTPASDDAIAHLEVETKHGAVVLFDHRRAVVHSDPPRPPDARGTRQWQDLTERLPEAFDGRPTLAAISLNEDGDAAVWIFELSTGATFTFVLHPTAPLLLAR